MEWSELLEINSFPFQSELYVLGFTFQRFQSDWTQIKKKISGEINLPRRHLHVKNFANKIHKSYSKLKFCYSATITRCEKSQNDTFKVDQFIRKPVLTYTMSTLLKLITF